MIQNGENISSFDGMISADTFKRAISILLSKGLRVDLRITQSI